jgi:phage terminase small subunit
MPTVRVPTAEKIKKGTLGSYDRKERIDDKLPALMQSGIPTIIPPPASVPQSTETVWYRVSGRLSAAGIWTDLDIEYLTRTCVELNQIEIIDTDINRYYAKMMECEQSLHEIEILDDEDKKKMQIDKIRNDLEYYRSWWSKLLTKRMNASVSFVKFASKLGMSPADRAGLKLIMVSADQIERNNKPKSALQKASTRQAVVLENE